MIKLYRIKMMLKNSYDTAAFKKKIEHTAKQLFGL